MTNLDLMALLRQKIAETSQAHVARQLEISDSALSQLMSGSYKANPDNILEKVRIVYGGISVGCPVLGEITLARCNQEQKRPFAATNPQRVRLYRECRICRNRK